MIKEEAPSSRAPSLSFSPKQTPSIFIIDVGNSGVYKFENEPIMDENESDTIPKEISLDSFKGFTLDNVSPNQ